MFRQLEAHKGISQVNGSLQIHVMDQPGKGGANQRYDITGQDASNNISNIDAEGVYPAAGCNPLSRLPIIFQQGEPAVVGVNGITMEALIVILIDRLRGFQAGPYACPENDKALDAQQQSLMWLERRAERVAHEDTTAT